MSNNEPRPIPAIAIHADIDRHLVLVELGNQTLALAPEAAHALSLALTNAASVLCPIAAERPKIGPPVDPAGARAADLLIGTIEVLLDRYRQGTLATPALPSKRAADLAPMALPPSRPTEVSVQGGATLSAPEN